MRPTRIALIGLPRALEAELKSLFGEIGHETDAPDPGSVDFRDPERFAAYDLVIAGGLPAEGGEEDALFSFLLSMRGSLILYAEGTGYPDRGAPCITAKTSPEEIVSMVNDAIFSGGGPPGSRPRGSPRIRTGIAVTYEAGSVRRDSRITSLSEKGAFIATLAPLPAGTAARISFALPGREKRIEAAGRILYAIGYDLARGIIAKPGSDGGRIGTLPGIGVSFDEISDADAEAVRRFIEENRYGG